MMAVMFFNEIGKEDVAKVGGKGANLGEMINAGFPVPEGFCITTKVYRELSKGVEKDNKTPEELRRVIRSLPLPEEYEKEIRESVNSFPEGTLFSVRSSATAEDLAFASFAGQQDTYLNVAAKDVIDAVRDCFASLFTDRAVSYRKQNGIQNADMSVVVQKMVRSDVSGVMFTVDPVSCHRDRLVIDGVFGLGEAIVSGMVSPDHYEYEKSTGKINIKEVPVKASAIIPLPDGGTEHRNIDSKEQVLDLKQIRELAEIGKNIEAHYGAPQDIEWAVENGIIYILQARAITSLYPCPRFEDNKFHFLFNMGYQQMYTKAMPVLSVDMLTASFNIGERVDFRYNNGMFVGGGNYMFGDFSRVLAVPPARLLFMKLIFPMIDPVAVSAFNELLGRKKPLKFPSKAILNEFRRNVIPGVIRHIKDDEPVKGAEALDAFVRQRQEKVRSALQDIPVSQEGLDKLFGSLGIADMFLGRFIPALMGGAVISLVKLKKIEKSITEEDKYLKDIQAGNVGNVGTEMNLHMGDLADLVNADAELKSMLEAEEFTKESLLQDHGEFSKCLEDFMDKYGFRCPGEIDIANSRWMDEPGTLVGQILGMSVNKRLGSHKDDFEEKYEKAMTQSAAFVAEVREKLGEKKAKEVQLLITKVRSYSALREHLKYLWMSNFSHARKCLLAFGESFTERGLMDKKDDIFHLYLKEINEAFVKDEDLRPVIKSRKEEFERISKLTPPRVITSEGEVLHGGIVIKDLPEGALAGSAVSSGVVEGIAKVVVDPIGASVEDGEILVAEFTDPGWTPLFVHAAGVVTEVGGMLTHGAVVAREYGIPGVVGVKDASKIIKTGQKIRVDGNAGYVQVLG